MPPEHIHIHLRTTHNNKQTFDLIQTLAEITHSETTSFKIKMGLNICTSPYYLIKICSATEKASTLV